MKLMFSALLILVSMDILCQIIPPSTSTPLKHLGNPTPIKKSGELNVQHERTCYTDEHTKNLQAKSNYYLSEEEFEKKLHSYIENSAAFRTSEEMVTIPVVVHVIHNGEAIGVGPNISQAQVQSQIDVLNEDFRRSGAGSNTHNNGADTNIEFVLAVIGVDGQEMSEPGINRVNSGQNSWDYESIESTLKPNTIWDPEKYFNILTLQFPEGDNTLGYAQFPNFSDLPGLEKSNGVAETDGVVIGYQFFGRTGNVAHPFDEGRTATHEVGHWLGLRHIWGDGDCSSDDYCADTPNAGQPNYSCEQVNSCDDGNGDANDMIENYMDYTNDACMNIFTVNQKERMRAVLAQSPRRKELISSSVGEASDIPVPNFIMSANSGCAGQVIDFTDNSTNNPTSWTWNFYSGGEFLADFTGETISITFNGPGVYSVELIAENGSGSSTLLQENIITIYDDISVNILQEDIENIDDPSFFTGWVVVNSDADRGWGITDESAFGNGINSLIFDNYSGGSDPTGTIDILVTPPLNLTGQGVPYISFDQAYAIYSNDYVDTLKVLYSLDCGITWEFLWSKGGNELATASPTEEPFFPLDNEWRNQEISLASLAGEQSVHLAFVNVSGWGNLLYLDNIIFEYVEVTQQVESAFSADKVRICENDVVQFNDNSLNTPSSWQWVFETGNPANSEVQHPKIRFDIAGFYDVSLTATNSLGGNTETKQDYIEVVAMPQMSIDGPQAACAGDDITLTASGGQNVKWISRGAVIFEGSTYSLKIQDNLELEITGENELGCVGSVIHNVEVIAVPDITATANVAGLCAPGEVTLTGTGAASYEWVSNGVVLGEESSLTTSLEETSTYTLVGYSSGKECSAEAEIVVELYNVATPEISFSSGTLTCTDASSYQWFLNTQEITGATTKTFTPTESGSYTVETGDNNGCKALSAAHIVEITSVEFEEAGQFSVYPNPVSNNLRVKGLQGMCSIRIYNNTGRLIGNDLLSGENGEIIINVNDLEKGFYLLDITDQQGKTLISKFLKQ